MLCLLEDFDQTIDEGGQPQEPFEKSADHDSAHDGNIDNLPQISWLSMQHDFLLDQLTSFVGHGSVMAATPFSLTAMLLGTLL